MIDTRMHLELVDEFPLIMDLAPMDLYQYKQGDDFRGVLEYWPVAETLVGILHRSSFVWSTSDGIMMILMISIMLTSFPAHDF